MKNVSHGIYGLSICLISGVMLSTASNAGGDAHAAKSADSGHFKMMDANADGKVSASEHATGANSMFEKIDANKDGKVTAAEMDANHKAMMGSDHHSSGAMAADSKTSTTSAGVEKTYGGAGHETMGHEGKSKMTSSADKIKVIDKDGDGSLTAAEHAAGSRSMFLKNDADKDGNLTVAEMQAGHERMNTVAND